MAVELLSPSVSVECAAWCADHAPGGGHLRHGCAGAAAIDDDPLRPSENSKARVEAQPPSIARAIGGGCGIHDQHRLRRRQPLIAPVARLAQRPGAHARCLDHGGDALGRFGAGALPARQRAVAVHDAEQRGDHPLQPRLERIGKGEAPRVIDFAHHGQQHDRVELYRRTPRDDAAIGESPYRARGPAPPRRTPVADRHPPAAARPRSPAPRRDARDAGRGLVGAAIQMPRARAIVLSTRER